VESCRCSAEHYRVTGPDDLGHGQAGQYINAVENQRTHQGDRRDQPHQGDRHHLDGYAGLDTVQQVLAGVVTVAEISGGGDGENRLRLAGHLLLITAEEPQHISHPLHTMFAECTGDQGAFGGDQ